MPTYSYLCGSCNHTFDRILKIADRKIPESEDCPACAQKTVMQSVASFSMGDPVKLGFSRPDNGFKEVLQKIDSRTAGSRLKEISNITKL